MKKVLAIIGSGRKLGNSEIMAKEISRKISTPHQLQLLRLPEFDIQYCNGCYRCLFKDGLCVIKDDLEDVLQAIAQADALILAVPTYFLSAHSSLKRLLDRGICFYSWAEKLWGKPAVGLGIAGIEGKEGSTLLDIERFFSAFLAENKLSRIVYGALPGEALLSDENCAVVEELASALFGSPVADDGLSCPLCGGQTFRFLSENKVRCMLCSDVGHLTMRGGQLYLKVERSEHELLASQSTALEHRDWLRDMVERFKERRAVLSELTAGYADDGQWFKPAIKQTMEADHQTSDHTM